MAELRFEASLSRPASPDASIQARLVLARENGDEREVVLEVPGRAGLELPANSRWAVSLHAEGYWSPHQQFVAAPPGRDLEVVLFPAGFLEARLDPGSADDPPSEIELHFSPSSGSEDHLLPSAVACPVEQNLIRCRLPAAKLDVRLEADEFVPEYHWGVKIPKDHSLRLGTWSMRRGASLVGWVEAPREDFFFESVDITLTPLIEGPSDPAVRKRFKKMRLASRAQDQGFFQFAGLAAGRYALVVDHPAYAPTRLDVSIRESEELELAPISLSEPASLVLQIDYPTDPYRKPWTVALSTRGVESGRLELIVDAPASLEGLLEEEGLTPGGYFLSLTDSRENRWHTESVELYPGTNVHPIEIQIRRLEGEVLLEDEPLPSAAVTIRERGGNSRFGYKTKDEGIFYAFLRGDAEWDIEVTHEILDVAAFFEKVEIPRKRSDGKYARKTFEIPGTFVFGRVVNVDGSPVEEPLMLDVLNDDGKTILQKPIASDAEFGIRGLPEETVEISARVDRSASQRNATSQPRRIVLQDGIEQGPVQLVVEDMFRLGGLVLGPSGDGVPGAQVIGLPKFEDYRAAVVEILNTVSDVDGVFDLPVPSGATSVDLTVLPPGFALAQVGVSTIQESVDPVILPVDTLGGTLRIVYEKPPVAWQASPIHLTTRTTVWSQFLVPTPFLISWAMARGSAGVVASGEESAWELPMLPAGPVKVCFGRLLAESSSDQCVAGQLPPDGELVLRVPEDSIRKEFEAVRAAVEGNAR